MEVSRNGNVAQSFIQRSLGLKSPIFREVKLPSPEKVALGLKKHGATVGQGLAVLKIGLNLPSTVAGLVGGTILGSIVDKMAKNLGLDVAKHHYENKASGIGLQIGSCGCVYLFDVFSKHKAEAEWKGA